MEEEEVEDEEEEKEDEEATESKCQSFTSILQEKKTMEQVFSRSEFFPAFVIYPYLTTSCSCA